MYRYHPCLHETPGTCVLCTSRCSDGEYLDGCGGPSAGRCTPLPPSLPPDAIVQVVTLQMQLPIPKGGFLARQPAFIAAIAGAAGVNPSDVQVESVEDVATKRQQAVIT